MSKSKPKNWNSIAGKSIPFLFLAMFCAFSMMARTWTKEIERKGKDNSYSLPKGSLGPSVDGEGVQLLRKLQDGFISVVSKVRPAVVFISISKSVTVPEFNSLNPFEEFFGQGGGPFGPRRFHQRPNEDEGRDGRRPRYHGRNKFRGTGPEGRKLEQVGLGSGFIIDNKKGFILTNNHVVGDADEITVQTHDGKKYTAKVIGTDEKTDVAVIEVKDLPASLGQVYLADSEKVQIGEWAIAVGAPLGLDQTVTSGIVSAKGRGSLKITGYGDFIQTDAAINPGNSGGPLLNIDGDVIGMNTAIFSQSGGSQGIGFAIPSKIMADVVTKLIRQGKVERAYLGVLIQDLTEGLAAEFGQKSGGPGVLVSQVEEGSPADKAGIREGDIITKIDGSEVKSAEQLSYVVGMNEPGKKVQVDYYRKGSAKNVSVILRPREEERLAKFGSKGKGEDSGSEQEEGRWGMMLEEAGRSQGLNVVAVEQGSPAAKAGIEEGDVILEVNHQKVDSVAEFKKLDNKKEDILLRVAKGNFFYYVTLKRK